MLGLALGALPARCRLLRLLADHRSLGKTGSSQHLLHTLGRLRALAKPVCDALCFQRQALVVVFRHHRVVGADPLDITAVTRGSSLGNNNTVKRALLGAAAGKSDLESHEYSSFRRELWLF